MSGDCVLRTTAVPVHKRLKNIVMHMLGKAEALFRFRQNDDPFLDRFVNDGDDLIEHRVFRALGNQGVELNIQLQTGRIAVIDGVHLLNDLLHLLNFFGSGPLHRQSRNLGFNDQPYFKYAFGKLCPVNVAKAQRIIPQPRKVTDIGTVALPDYDNVLCLQHFHCLSYRGAAAAAHFRQLRLIGKFCSRFQFISDNQIIDLLINFDL